MNFFFEKVKYRNIYIFFLSKEEVVLSSEGFFSQKIGGGGGKGASQSFGYLN